MIEEKESQIRYLDKGDIELIHSILSLSFQRQGEPIPSFEFADPDHLDALIKTPQSRFFGFEQYPSLASKAAIIFYTLNKKHLFLNGNKRISVACLNIFLLINNKRLHVSEDELRDKALWLAQTTHTHSFQEIKDDLIRWIESNIADFEFE